MPVGSSWLYLACVVDMFSRKVVGYSMATHTRTRLVIDALDAAVASRGGQVRGVIFHSDGGRNTPRMPSRRFAQLTAHEGARVGSVRAMTTPWPRTCGWG